MGKVFTITEGLQNLGALKTGGQGSVYKGRRIGEIITAVKLLPTPIYSESINDKNFRDFQNEVEKLKKVNEQPNPNVVKILNSGITESGSFPFIEMEFIEGPDLEELLKPPHDPVFTIKEAIKLADQLASALAHCHKVNVKHGDIKSNNVKFNIHSSNYVLLDFGLAAMSDEQRRTSLRHAGAIEFMAPEQNNGQQFFQTDVYSFGVILFELLAGVVPFPLRDSGETARNLVMVAHMEKTPPDILTLRSQHVPASWISEKKERELQVPRWLLDMVYKCLEKKPEARFSNGVDLHDYIVLNSTLTTNKTEFSANGIGALQTENKKLLQEKADLQRLLVQYQEAATNKERDLATLRTAITHKDLELTALRQRVRPQQYTPEPKRRSKFPLFAILLLMGLLGAFVAYSVLFDGERPPTSNNQNANTTTEAETVEQPKAVMPKQRDIIGQYKVVADKAYFHNTPEDATRREAYMVPSIDVVDAMDEQNGFIYTEFTNNKGQTSKGWLNKQDLQTLTEWEQANNTPATTPEQDVNAQLQQAKTLMDNNFTDEALPIYKSLADQQVPEAMYHYGNLALQNKNVNIDCQTALTLINNASDKGYAAAKRTLGFLYLFAENNQVLKLANYDRCQYGKNVLKGSKLLMEAVLSGDTAAKRILDEFNNQNDTIQ